MNKKKILGYCSIFSVLGIFLLWGFSETSQFEEKSICDVEKGDWVQIEGKISNFQCYEDVCFFELENSCDIKGVIFEKVEIEKGSFSVEGKIDIYNGEKEIIADKLSKIA